MAEATHLDTTEAEKERSWRQDQLRRLGYNQKQRVRLLERIELHELELEDVRHLAALGCPADAAWWILS